MSVYTPKDSFDRPAILGNCNGKAIPVKVSGDGSVANTYRYHLTDVVRLDLSVFREKEHFEVAMDSFAVIDLKGSFFMYLDSEEDNRKCTINKCISVDVTAQDIYISNEVQEGYAEIWIFKFKEGE